MSLLAKVKELYGKAVERAAAHDLPTVTALLVLPVFKTLKPARKPDARTIIVLPKDGFTPDIMTALADADGVKVVALPRIVVKFFARAFLPYFIDDNNYASCGAEYDEAKKRYRTFLVALLKSLRRFIRIDAIATGNFAYAAERELAWAASDLGIPFIVLHKENLKTPGLEAFYQRLYIERRGRFGGSRVLVYNQVEHDIQVASGVAEKSQIEIVGMPRLDDMHAWRRQNAGRKETNRILFFAFAPITGAPQIPRKTAEGGQFRLETLSETEVTFTNLAIETCGVMRRLAEENPDLTVVVKTKGRPTDFADIREMFGVKSENEFPPNMQVVHGGDIMPLIAEASVVCGFNSTALLEAMAAGKPIVVPWFAEADDPEMEPYVLDLRGICETPRSPQALSEKLVELARNPSPVAADLDEQMKLTLFRWAGNDDGLAGFRSRDAILRAIGG